MSFLIFECGFSFAAHYNTWNLYLYARGEARI